MVEIPRNVAVLIAAASRKFVIRHPDGSPYITRWVLAGSPALEDHDPAAPYSIYVHQLHTPDPDRHMHNHPWSWATGLILAGGYTEWRLDVWQRRSLRTFAPGDLNRLDTQDYHAIVGVQPNTYTLFSVGREIQDWGFLVDGVHVPHREYFQLSDAVHMYHTEETL